MPRNDVNRASDSVGAPVPSGSYGPDPVVGAFKSVVRELMRPRDPRELTLDVLDDPTLGMIPGAAVGGSALTKILAALTGAKTGRSGAKLPTGTRSGAGAIDDMGRVARGAEAMRGIPMDLPSPLKPHEFWNAPVQIGDTVYPTATHAVWARMQGNSKVYGRIINFPDGMKGMGYAADVGKRMASPKRNIEPIALNVAREFFKQNYDRAKMLLQTPADALGAHPVLARIKDELRNDKEFMRTYQQQMAGRRGFSPLPRGSEPKMPPKASGRPVDSGRQRYRRRVSEDLSKVPKMTDQDVT